MEISLPDKPLTELIPFARGAAALAGESGMQVWSVHLPFSRRLDISNPDDEGRENALAELYRTIDLAREVGVTADYLTRQFKLLAGITPLTYLRRFRIARAMELLGQGISASEAAQRVGFHSLSHFSREFKRELGISPTQFKQQEHT